MSQMTVYQPPSVGALIPFDEIQKMAKAVAASGLFGLKNEAQAVALMLFAQSENLHPMTAVRDYHIMGGKPSMKADTMLARFQANGGEVEWERYDDTAVIGVFSHGKRKPVRVEWTMERARVITQEIWEDNPNGGRRKRTQPITDKDVWKHYPRNMLRARCASEGIRAVMPGVLCGLYTPEEIQDISHVATAETSGPNLPPPEPELPDVDSLLADLAACQTLEECRAWLPIARKALNLHPGDPLYAGFNAEATARADQIKAAQQPEPGPDAHEFETELEMIE